MSRGGQLVTLLLLFVALGCDRRLPADPTAPHGPTGDSSAAPAMAAVCVVDAYGQVRRALGLPPGTHLPEQPTPDGSCEVHDDRGRVVLRSQETADELGTATARAAQAAELGRGTAQPAAEAGRYTRPGETFGLVHPDPGLSEADLVFLHLWSLDPRLGPDLLRELYLERDGLASWPCPAGSPSAEAVVAALGRPLTAAGSPIDGPVPSVCVYTDPRPAATAVTRRLRLYRVAVTDYGDPTTSALSLLARYDPATVTRFTLAGAEAALTPRELIALANGAIVVADAEGEAADQARDELSWLVELALAGPAGP